MPENGRVVVTLGLLHGSEGKVWGLSNRQDKGKKCTGRRRMHACMYVSTNILDQSGAYIQK